MRSETSAPTPQAALCEAFDSFTRVSDSLQKAYTDLQERVRYLSEKLESANYFLESVLHSLPSGLLVVDSQGRLLTINRRAAELLGVDENEWDGLADVESLLRAVPDRNRVSSFFGDEAPGEISLRLPQRRVLTCIWSEMKQGERLLTLQDVTRVRSLETRMRRAERLATMGEMSLEVAHEIRNPLTSLGLFASLLRAEGLSSEERRKFVEQIEIGVRTLDLTLSNMLAFWRDQHPRLRETDPLEILSRAVDFLLPLVEERGIEVEGRLGDSCPVQADPELLEQMFLTLVHYCLQALPREGRLTLESFVNEANLLLVVSDDGLGLDSTSLERLFEPHFSTTDKGNGLGLGVVKKIIEAHSGAIQVESPPGRGTIFALTFPREVAA